MAIVRVIITLKPGILDAAGQAVRQGLHALGYQTVSDVRVGRYIEIAVPDGMGAAEINEMCQRFLANPLIEEWRLDTSGNAGRDAGAKPLTRERGNTTGRPSKPHAASTKSAPEEIH